MSDWETQKKTLLPYLQRAAEIESVDPKVAYYCRLYAVEQGIKLEQRDRKADDLLELVLNQLEKDKPYLVLDTAVDLGHCERFAMGVYLKAKRRDEQGIADRDTAKAYYAAFNFIEILKQFGQLSEDVERERRFAVFRAAEIKRHLDEGKQPPSLVPSTDNNNTSAATPTETVVPKTELPPLIDYDPGYVIGGRTLFRDEASNTIQKGLIKSKATEVGGFFNVQGEDGSEQQLGALFMAPDLHEGDTVSYYGQDGGVSDCEVIQTMSAEWPPLYILRMEDGSTHSVRHSNFTLNYAPKAADAADAQAEDNEPSLSFQPPSVQDSEKNSEVVVERSNEVRKRESWLVPKDSSKRIIQAPSASQPTTPTPLVTAESPSQGPSISNIAGTTAASHRLPSLQHQPSYPTSWAEYAGDGSDYFTVDSPKITQANIATRLKSDRERFQFHPSERSSGFEPTEAAVKQATKCTHNAAAALNFSDVDHAVHCLQEALKLLTQQRSP